MQGPWSGCGRLLSRISELAKVDERDKSSTCDVLVAGGSFVGLTVALALSRSSQGVLSVTVVDRTPPEVARAATNDGRATALSAASVHLFQTLGVWDEVKAHAEPFSEIDITDSRLDAVARPPLLHFDGALGDGEPAAYMLENHILRAALMAAADAAEGVSFLAPETVDGFSVSSSAVTAQLGDGGAVKASLLVAADGRRSALRKMAGIKSIGWTYPQAGIAATLGIEKPHGGRAVQHFLPPGPFAILPLQGDRVSLVWTESRGRAQEIVALDDEAFLQEAKKRMGGRHGALSVAGPPRRLSSRSASGAVVRGRADRSRGRCSPRGAPPGGPGPEYRPAGCGRVGGSADRGGATRPRYRFGTPS